VAACALLDALAVRAELLAAPADWLRHPPRADNTGPAINAGVFDARALVILRDWLAKNVVPLVIAVRQALKIVEGVVAFVLVSVMDVPAVWDRPDFGEPPLSVKAESALGPNGLVCSLVIPAAVSVPALPAPFNATIAHA
jgi:hypothetical protein